MYVICWNSVSWYTLSSSQNFSQFGMLLITTIVQSISHCCLLLLSFVPFSTPRFNLLPLLIPPQLLTVFFLFFMLKTKLFPAFVRSYILTLCRSLNTIYLLFSPATIPNFSITFLYVDVTAIWTKNKQILSPKQHQINNASNFAISNLNNAINPMKKPQNCHHSSNMRNEIPKLNHFALAPLNSLPLVGHRNRAAAGFDGVWRKSVGD